VLGHSLWTLNVECVFGFHSDGRYLDTVRFMCLGSKGREGGNELITELYRMFVGFNCDCILLSGFNPRWNQEMNFSLKVPELAMVHFAVKDCSTTGKDAVLGMYALPFTSMWQGRAG